MYFLPITKKEMDALDWGYLDFVIITGDAYVDHPSFGASIIGRILLDKGFKVGVIPQPDWNTTADFLKLPKPRLAFLVSSGNIDSMVNNYTVAKKKRTEDVYAPGKQAGLRPDYAVIVYSQKLREIYKNEVPIILGGIEASLRRLAHYDYWQNKVKKSILLDASADLLVYGMGENQMLAIARMLDRNIPVHKITNVPGTVYATKNIEKIKDYVCLPSFEEVKKNKRKFAESFLTQYQNTDFITGKTLVEPYDGLFIVKNPPAKPLMESELDNVHALPFMRNYHPSYEKSGGIHAIQEVKFSIMAHRGCFGHCNFCALSFHQGTIVSSRSCQSILKEAENFVSDQDFKGYIHDVGGPTANFNAPACDRQLKDGACGRSCLFPTPCKNLKISHKSYLSLLKQLREIKGVKKVFIRSGIRYDYVMSDHDSEFFYELCKHHVSGQLKVAPEHISPNVLAKMGKPSKKTYEAFTKKFYEINKKIKKEQYLVPYLMSSHPGCTLQDAVALAEYIRDTGHKYEQVQDFYPTPGTLSTCMYYTELDPRTMEKIYVAKSPHEKALQRALLQYKLPNNYNLVLEALKKAGREDLIGFSAKCLIKPVRIPKGGAIKKKENVKKKTIRNVHVKKIK